MELQSQSQPGPHPQVVVAGLGPGAWEQVTIEVRSLLESVDLVYVRTRTHPTAEHLPDHLEIRSFDYLYEQEERFEDIYRKIAEELVSVAVSTPSDGRPVVYCVPGHPAIGEASVRHLRKLASARGIEVKLLAGLSFIEPVCSALGIDPVERGLQIVDGTELAGYGGHVNDGGAQALPHGRYERQSREPFLFSPYSIPVEPSRFPALAGLSPMYPVLLCQVYNERVASACKLVLLERYPADHPVSIVLNAGVPGEERVVVAPLAEMDHGHGINHLACVYLPPLDPLSLPHEFDSLVYVMGRLRGPGGCPWDREQTHQSLKRYLLEEAYETVDAIESGDPDMLAEELGDVLLQVVFHAQVAVAEEEFTLADVVGHIVRKLIRRHPHVFGDVQVTGAEHVVRNWEAIKARERRAGAGKPQIEQAVEQGLEGTGLLLGVPRAMPALERAQQLQARAARVGFDWADIEGVFDKVREELAELQSEQSSERRAEELGDLLFALVNLAQWMGINAEEALRRANDKFLRRFAAMERAIVQSGGQLRGMSIAQMDRFWQEVKSQDEVRQSDPS
jgi:tetrapyrrole methylase family protein/MazG family protein